MSLRCALALVAGFSACGGPTHGEPPAVDAGLRGEDAGPLPGVADAGLRGEDAGPLPGAGMTLGCSAPGEPHVPVGEGGRAAMVRGPQGGYHIWLSLEAPGVRLEATEDAIVVDYDVVTGVAVAEGRAYVPLESVEATTVRHSGIIMFLEEGVDPAGQDGAEARVHARLQTERGRVLGEASARWTLGCCDVDAGPP